MTQFFRNQTGGLIDRAQRLSFRFDGNRFEGFKGDTLASALLASGVRLVGRSFKYHRPRGVFSIGPEEPCAIVSLGARDNVQPNIKATLVELADGLIAKSQNRWPTIEVDVLSVNDHITSLLAAGFYYKTFMEPKRFWPLYEKLIRRAAGMGKASTAPDSNSYERRYAHCDVLIVGAGPAGITAAQAAASSGAKVILVDEAPAPGGWLRRERLIINGLPGHQWADQALVELQERRNATVLSRTTAFGYYDHNLIGLVQRIGGEVAERLWRVRARQVILATGAIERPIAFANNDRPGVMLAAAARGYLNEFAVRPGKRAVVFTNNDSAYRTAIDLQDGGVDVAAIIDVRADKPGSRLIEAMGERDIPLDRGSVVTRALGRRTLKGVEVAAYSPGFISRSRSISCDLLCVSGGWSPAVHLHAQSGGRPDYDESLCTFVPGESKQAERSVGAARGRYRLSECLEDGLNAGRETAKDCGFKPDDSLYGPETALVELSASSIEALWSVPTTSRRAKCFVDIHNDVALKDVRLAHREGYDSVEHLKRYTTLGMGTDQGKTSNIIGLALLAEMREQPIPKIGTTTFRPPYTLITMGVLAGHDKGPHLKPVRRSPMYAQHEKLKAVFAPNALWQRPQYYLINGATAKKAVARESLAVRNNVGISDVSTLGKVEISGRDAGAFLDRIYVNNLSSLKPGRIRYGLMLREDGMIFDDGTLTQLAADRYFITTTTGNAERVRQHMEYWLDVVWSDLDANLIDVTEQWAAVSVAGPNSRRILDRVLTETDLSADMLSHMRCTTAKYDDIDARILRVSFSGELAFEVYVPSGYGGQLWQQLIEMRKEYEIVPFGMDALEVLRIEKGYIGVGSEADGRVTPYDLGFGAIINLAKDFVGKWGLGRPALHEADRPHLIGLEPLDGRSPIGVGAQILDEPASEGTSIGHVSSAATSRILGRPIALAMLRGGRYRKWDTVYVADPLRGREPVPARVVDPCFYDPEGKRLKM